MLFSLSRHKIMKDSSSHVEGTFSPFIAGESIALSGWFTSCSLTDPVFTAWSKPSIEKWNVKNQQKNRHFISAFLFSSLLCSSTICNNSKCCKRTLQCLKAEDRDTGRTYHRGLRTIGLFTRLNNGLVSFFRREILWTNCEPVPTTRQLGPMTQFELKVWLVDVIICSIVEP